MKIGILGGTFNPIHNGHLINAQYLKDDYSLDSILFIPSKHPVHKELEGNVTPEDRYEMTRLAVQDNDDFDVSRIEIEREDESFTIITIKELIELYKEASFYLILGSDAFNEVDTWRDYTELVELVSFIVMRRHGSKEHNKEIIERAEEVIFADNPVVEISSSQIRNKIRIGKSIRYLVPSKVEEYIYKRGLYKI